MSNRAMTAPLAFRAGVADAHCLCSPVGLAAAVYSWPEALKHI